MNPKNARIFLVGAVAGGILVATVVGGAGVGLAVGGTVFVLW